MTVYQHAKILDDNIRFSSDSATFEDCYCLCANKKHIDELKTRDHQVIWGRRGTGKTTLQKAFVHEINTRQNDPCVVAFYFMMAHIVPTNEEILLVTGSGNALALYVFSKLITSIINEIEKLFKERCSNMEKEAEDQFVQAYLELTQDIDFYLARIRGAELSVEQKETNESQNESGYSFDITGNAPTKLIRACLNYLKKRKKTHNTIHSTSLSGRVSFQLETSRIEQRLKKMLEALQIDLAYICLDEYSEIDKISDYSIQSTVAQLIKQVFFKSSLFSVKIATIWNNSKLHMRGGHKVEGIEYKQDIFPGPDLDIMFMKSNADVIKYFKTVLVNTYCMSCELSEEEQLSFSEYIEERIFSKAGLRHLICGSQGISRSFVILVKEYLQIFLQERKGPVKLGKIYELIMQQYLEDVRSKIPYFSVYTEINKYIAQNLRRYFLIERKDYDRCKDLLKYLATRGVFMQLPGHLTDRSIRNSYKLFIIHYGNYLDALDSARNKKGRKRLEEDSKLEENGLLLPDYDDMMLSEPNNYVVHLPKDAEKEMYCPTCKAIVKKDDQKETICTQCGNSIISFSAFVDDATFDPH